MARRIIMFSRCLKKRSLAHAFTSRMVVAILSYSIVVVKFLLFFENNIWDLVSCGTMILFLNG